MSGTDGTNPPNNLQGLLRLAIEHSPANVDTTSPNVATLDSQQRRWLQEALSSMTGNVTDIMKQTLDTLMKGGDREDEVAAQELAFERISEWAENQDIANDFEKIGGFKIFPGFLKSPHSSLRQRCAELIAILVQNNPYCKTAAMSSDLLPSLLELADIGEDTVVRTKALYAVSVLVRDNPPAEQQFTHSDGFSVLLKALQSPDSRLRTKAAFFMTALCRQQPAFKDTLCDMGFVEQLAALIQGDHDITHEHILSALLGLATGHNRTIQECQRSEIGLETLLLTRMTLLRDKDEYEEERSYCEELLNLCFSRKSQDDTVRNSQDESVAR